MVKVSFLIPVYNEEERISGTIQSIIDDTSIPYNIIIVNDASTDKTLEVIESFQGKADIIVVNNKINSHIAISLNNGVEYCNEYILRCDSGDLICNDRAKKQLAVLEEGADICYCEFVKDGIDIKTRVTYKNLGFHNRFYNYFCHSTLAIKKESLLRIGKYKNLMPAEDFELLLNAYKHKFKMGLINEPLLIYDDVTVGISKANAKKQVKAYQYISWYYILGKEKQISVEKFRKYISTNSYFLNYFLHKANRLLYRVNAKEIKE